VKKEYKESNGIKLKKEKKRKKREYKYKGGVKYESEDS
jgi:hypothetical protein